MVPQSLKKGIGTLRQTTGRYPSNLEFQYTLKGETLENVSSTPYLGVCLSETLEWEAHINKITSKANSTLGFLRRNLKACPPKLRETAYFSLVRSSLEYSSAVWDTFTQKDIDKLEKIQRAAARFVTQNYRQTASVTSLIHNLGWTDFKKRWKNSRLLCMFKIFNELVEIPINDSLIPADKWTCVHGHNQAYKHIRANTYHTGTKFFLASNYPWLEFSSGSCHRIENCGSIQESAGRLDLSASFPPPAWYSTMEGCWSIYSLKVKVKGQFAPYVRQINTPDQHLTKTAA